MPQVDPLRLTSDAAFMSDFRKSQSRDVLNYYLELLGENYETMLINNVTTPIEVMRYYQGILAGLKMAQDIPENVLKWAKEAAGEASEGKLGKLTLA